MRIKAIFGNPSYAIAECRFIVFIYDIADTYIGSYAHAETPFRLSECCYGHHYHDSHH